MKKPQLLRYEEWQSCSGRYYVNDTSDLTSVRALWWVPAHLLEKTLDEFVQLLINDFQVKYINFDGKTLTYSWDELDKARKFKNWINAQARKSNWIL